ncbi:symmetrical bis(5'-nucleosyl)-tetraphosphatase [Legionella hackeliae]|uniref:Bis(5'-nucleosyl)-tetraphosphatase, symmetrical n=1 Tax=Legionella hackeliae TaxID=449 RepID=A0A0A8UYJ2_LEGHA|nr:symmetrical bis(5'-nucleosyl)-tetraphosphatase [Legionella hackeliae]KTD12754.1 bis(5'-nucleosyl)-tetraphosphatase [Legionella hackeliae]CEK12177.1 Bis(5'-nucleosyl)-tetraphosphatase, symmetrical [Legionella hackeliae]STX48963.1 bis(5'-nucleosyl)-tetraphosphatase [Legionella hackeliae]
MSDYAIGDVQGCYEPLQRLLEHIHFDERRDRLWFVGDLVNRGPQSLEVLRFVKQLPLTPRITLGNHDLHLLNKLFGEHPHKNADDSLHAVLAASDGEELGHWLRKQSILWHDEELEIVMCHAGIPPVWDLSEAKRYARELELTLSGENYRDFFSQMYGNEPSCWANDLTGLTRLRVITNYFTRMRFCNKAGCLLLDYKGTIKEAPVDYLPWYAVPMRKSISVDIVFGHWAALEGKSPEPTIYAIDTGCLWGRKLTALRLQDRKRFSVSGLKK